MTQQQWKDFNKFREEFREVCKLWKDEFSEILKPLQKTSANQDKVPEYNIENPSVYNTALDKITQEDDIKLIVIGDNPGKNEQLEVNKKYLVGQSGKIAEGFFAKNPELEIDFRKNVIILNKTPFHTAKTKELQLLAKEAGEKIGEIIEESQEFMARETANLAKDLNLEIWLVGYSELKPKGIFALYREALKSAFEDFAKSKVYVYQHFSMNRFLVDLKECRDSSKSLKENLVLIGENHKKEIFGI